MHTDAATDAATDETSRDKRQSAFKQVLGATFALEFGLGLQRGVFNNFVVETLGIEPSQLGFVQGIREVPGLLTAVLAVAAAYFRENTWAGICLFVAGMGLALHAAVGSFWGLVAVTLVLSAGFHLFYPVQSSIVMKASLRDERATRMGQLNSAAAMASLVSLAAVLAASSYMSQVNYRMLHVFAGTVTCAGGLILLIRPMAGVGLPGRSLEFNPKYMSYYVLTLLSGARRHVTMTFAGYLLVRTYHTPVRIMVILSAVSSMVAIVTRPVIGKIIDRWGEQRSLVFNYLIVVALFLGYAWVRVPALLYIIYILDNGMTGFDVAITTHVGKIAAKEALSAAYAMGSTINHITGVSVPMLGGYIWDMAGSSWVFLAGAAIAGISLAYSVGLEKRERIHGVGLVSPDR